MLTYDDISAELEQHIDRLDAVEQSSFTKVHGPAGPDGPRLYLSNSKGPGPRRIDIACDPDRVVGLPGIVPPRRPNGAVVAELDPAHPEALATFRAVLAVLAGGEG